MRFETDLIYVDSLPPGEWYEIQACASEWQLWFYERNTNWDNPIVESFTFHTKPTKRQIRKLRRQFRKSLWSYDSIGTGHSYGIKPDFVTVTNTGVEYGYFKTNKEK